MAKLDINNLTGRDDAPGLADSDLAIAPGEFVSIVGKRGCGKSTLLRLLAGRPGHALVAEDHGLFSWLTIEENVSLGRPGPEEGPDVRAAIALAGLAGAASDYACGLSAAMSIRTAIARALAGGSGVLLLDDPFGALDPQAGGELRLTLQRIRDEACVTIVLATHDIEHAVHLSDRIVVMQPRPGRIRRIVDVDLFHPRDRHGADFHAVEAAVLDALRGASRTTLTACR